MKDISIKRDKNSYQWRKGHFIQVDLVMYLPKSNANGHKISQVNASPAEIAWSA